ncbi:MAG: hypothetical protein GYA36_18240, partial [Veillonellaceae bacterium]|nr:hypothetical protein [Veillonellaceae bacterium]
IAIDALNVSGVRALEPYSQKPVVCFKRDWRIITGSVKEFVLLGVLTVLIFSMNYAQSIGGPRRIINLILHSPRITAEEYLRAGLNYCRVAGSFRWQDGRIEEVEWPVIGTEGAHLVYWTGKDLVQNPSDGEFLRSVLRQHEISWSIVQVKGLQKVSTECFWLDGKGKWHYSKPGDLATGTIKTAPGEIQSLEPATDPLHSITLDGWADNLFSTAENDVAGRKEVTAR